MDGLNVRPFGPDDEHQVIDLWTACNLIVSSNNPVEDIKRKMDDSPELFFVGEMGSDIVATCMAGYDGHRGWIYYLAVKPAMQKRNIASSMMRHAENILKSLGCPKINLMVRRSNPGVISFYDKIGYADDPVVVLSKRLSKDAPF